MKFSYTIPLLFILLATTMSGCDLIGDIFEFGFWTAIIIIVVIVLIIGAIFRALRGRR